MSASISQTRRLALAGLVVALGLGLDQWTKRWAFTTLRQQPAKVLVEDWLELDYAFNPGSAFGMFGDEPGARTIFIVTTVFALLYIATLLWRPPGEARTRRVAATGTISLALMAAGALGNLIDRLWRLDEVRVRIADELQFWLLIEHPVKLSESLLRGRNYLDLPRYGVVDFIVVYYWPERRWPSFNVADTCLVVGVGLFLIYLARLDAKPGPDADA
ncbi:lipoprotein signal peptidase [Enhygromyxa salina]|uniref:Lipoprotein signal peptidase n=1 Tax=Enhygromyxa salina TaxID=215803 RepID=A0A2S9XK35_9BACT|nr:signal peptidase II [Enhygromyxa salina]PRP93041.1 lipoprotein signal peptidase [Enhygromyxa salina]